MYDISGLLRSKSECYLTMATVVLILEVEVARSSASSLPVASGDEFGVRSESQ